MDREQMDWKEREAITKKEALQSSKLYQENQGGNYIEYSRTLIL